MSHTEGSEPPTIYSSENPEVCDTDFHPPELADFPARQNHVFRLIELLPGVDSDGLKANLTTHELTDTIEYEAISYVWGKDKSSEPLECNGRNLSITLNLEAALRRIRLPKTSKIIWVDAICINQGKPKERSHHVSFMNKIYQRAKHVLACMGKDPDGGAGDVAALIKEHITRMDGRTDVAQMPELDASSPIFQDTRWRTMGVLMHREWFSRAWVLQEVGVAKDPRVLYGSVEFGYRDLMNLARWIVRCASPLQSTAGIDLLTVHTDWEDWTKNWRARTKHNYTLLDFLSHAKGLGCHEKHDHVYAFLGHPFFQLEEGRGPWLIPDYKHKSVGDLYTELTLGLLKKLGLHVLSAVEHDERELSGDSVTLTINENIASWVVRWDMDVIWNSMGYYDPFYYRACGGDTRITATPENKVLEVQAVLVDIVAAIYQFSKAATDWQTEEADQFLQRNNSQNEVLGQIWRDVFDGDLPSRYPGNQWLDALNLTLGAGLRNYVKAEGDIEQYRANYAAFWELRESILSSRPALTETRQLTPQGSANDFLFDVTLSCKGRTFFVTREGYYGLGPWLTKPGDECYIINGTRVPFVLRQAEGGMVKLLGESYIHGIMNGEVERNWTDLRIS